MCLLCVADEVPDPLKHCPTCGCPIVLIDGAYYCTPEECWCMEQPDVGEWHALRNPDEPPLPPDWAEKTWEAVKDLFD